MWSDDGSNLYKVATFPNSDGEPYGLTIKGKGKHIDAHNKVMETLNRLPKDKATCFGDFQLTVTDKVKTNILLNAKVTLTKKDKQEGQVEIKIHKPSDRGKKATIEIQKLSGHDYETVETVKDIVTNMIDEFTAGESVSKIMLKAKGKAKPYTPIVKQPSLLIKLLACNECDFKVKTMPALKTHIISNHKQKKHRCEKCGFESSEVDMEDHNKEFHLVHQNIQQQKKRKQSVFACDQCGVTVDAENKLKNHKQSQHSVSSPEPSPPRKKPVKDVELDAEVTNAENKDPQIKMPGVEQMDYSHSEEKPTQDENIKEANKEVLKKEEIIIAQNKIIKDQEKELCVLREDNEIYMKANQEKKLEVKVSKEPKPIPSHLSPVQDQHLKDLLGIHMKCDGNAEGDCLSSFTTLHLSSTNDKSERRKNNRLINLHIADNYDTF